MGIYQKYILPKLINFGMQNKLHMSERKKIIPTAEGVVLEIGIGSGLNIPFYASKVKKLYALDTSLELWKIAKKRTKNAPFPIEFIHSSAENIPLADETIDTAISTWTLCTIPNPVRALQEIKRVLRHNSVFIFIEHGLSLSKKNRVLQNKLTPLWKLISGGCHLNRKIDDLISSSGFKFVEIQKDNSSRLSFLSFSYKGKAKKF